MYAAPSDCSDDDRSAGCSFARHRIPKVLLADGLLCAAARLSVWQCVLHLLCARHSLLGHLAGIGRATGRWCMCGWIMVITGTAYLSIDQQCPLPLCGCSWTASVACSSASCCCGRRAAHHSRAKVVVSSFQNFCVELMLARSFSEWASSMFGPKEIMSRPG
jgi:hypothetical protein